MKVFHFCLCRINQISVCIVKIEKQNNSVKSMFVFRQISFKIDTYRKSVIRVQILPFLLRVLRTLLHPAFLILCITAWISFMENIYKGEMKK